jgi:hypothetical protein
MESLEVIYEDSNLQISKNQMDSNIAILCFAGAKKRMGGIDKDDVEFYQATSGATTIFIVDKARSCGNLDWDLLYKVISAHIVNKRVFALGNSMGGSYAILASRHFKIEKVIAFVPPYSVHNSVVPSENRWKVLTDAITDWKYISLEDSFVDETEYHIFFGNHPADTVQRLCYPEQKNIIMKLYEGNHNLAKKLKEKGLLYNLIAEIIT